MEAVREALLNCTVHRDYSFSGSNLIHIYDDRMEFVSLGGLVPGPVICLGRGALSWNRLDDQSGYVAYRLGMSRRGADFLHNLGGFA